MEYRRYLNLNICRWVLTSEYPLKITERPTLKNFQHTESFDVGISYRFNLNIL